jgi:hypothetical protein
MQPLDFVLWLKGFIKASNPYNITPKQWDDLCEQINKVDTDHNLQSGIKYVTDSKNVTLSKGYISDTTYNQNVLTTNTILHD